MNKIKLALYFLFFVLFIEFFYVDESRLLILSIAIFLYTLYNLIKNFINNDFELILRNIYEELVYNFYINFLIKKLIKDLKIINSKVSYILNHYYYLNVNFLLDNKNKYSYLTDQLNNQNDRI